MIPEKTLWVLIDLDNGNVHDKRGHNYLWWFHTKKEAAEFKHFHELDHRHARLSDPLKLYTDKYLKTKK